MSKVKLTAEESLKVQAHMKSIMAMSGSDRESFIALTIGDVYDLELPIPEVIEAIARTVRAGNRPEDNHVYYMVPINITKKVYVLTSNCNVTQEQVTPNSRAELSFTELVTPDFWVCLKDFLTGDHDALQLYADSMNEAMDRQEIYAVLNLLDAGAISAGNTFTLSSGADSLDFPKLVEMARSLAKYGTKLVLITGANVTTDIMLMDYDSNKFREHGLSNLNMQHIPIEDLQVTIDGSAVDVIDADTAYLVAVSDSQKNRPIVFARRKVSLATDLPGTSVMGKERLVIDTGNIKNIGATVKFARGKAGWEQYGAVLINENVVAKFTRS